MSPSGNIALSVLVASALLSLRTPAMARSWSEKARFRRSFLIVTLCALNCFLGDVAPYRDFAYFSYVNLIIAAHLIVAQLLSVGSVWTGHRTLLVTRLMTSVLACLIAWQGGALPLTFIVVTVIAGVSHALLVRAEISEIIIKFSYLKNRLATLESTNQRFKAHAEPDQTEARDKSREAG